MTIAILAAVVFALLLVAALEAAESDPLEAVVPTAIHHLVVDLS